MFILSSILVMWLMIFGVAIYYFASLQEKLTSRMIYQFILIILVSSLTWIFIAYDLCLGNGQPLAFLQNSYEPKKILDLLFQLCFCLYAVVMLIGSVIDRMPTRQLTLIVCLWILFVYSPLVFLFWNSKGLLALMGVKDFSGGMVVHLSAGLSSLILAKLLGKSPHQHPGSERIEWQFISMIMISFGWFGFNMGPAGDFNALAVSAFFNTFIAIISGGLTWTLLVYMSEKKGSAIGIINGILVGLVSSTAGVGYVNPLQMAMICSLSIFLTYYASFFFQKYTAIDDVVDSFVMNGIGGLSGSLLLIICDPKLFSVQVFAVMITIVLSIVFTLIITYTTKYLEKVI